MTVAEVRKMLEELVGDHILSAVAYGKDGNGIFKLDGVTLEVVVDEDDGCRSYMDELKITKEIPDMYEIPVFAAMCENADHDLIEMRDKRNGKTVLTFGTKELSDYYPSYVFDYQPQNIFENNEVEG